MAEHGHSVIAQGYGCRIENGGYGIGDIMLFRKKEYVCEISLKICTCNIPCEECLVGNYFLNFDEDKLSKIFEDYDL